MMNLFCAACAVPSTTVFCLPYFFTITSPTDMSFQYVLHFCPSPLTDHTHRIDQGELRQALECGIQATAIGLVAGTNMGGQYVQACRLLCVRCGRQSADHGHCEIFDWPIASAFLRRKCGWDIRNVVHINNIEWHRWGHKYRIYVNCNDDNGNGQRQDHPALYWLSYIGYIIRFVYVELVCRYNVCTHMQCVQTWNKTTKRDCARAKEIERGCWFIACVCLFTPYGILHWSPAVWLGTQQQHALIIVVFCWCFRSRG